MNNPAPAGFFVFGAVRFVCRMAAAPYPAYGVDATCSAFVGLILGTMLEGGLLL